MWNGYDSGYFLKEKCRCVNTFEFSDLVSKKTQGTFKAKEVDNPEEL